MKKKTGIIVAAIAVAVIVIIALGIMHFSGSRSLDEMNIDYDDQQEISGIIVDEITSYSGPFVEDGSDENVSDVMQIKVTNNGDNDFQLLRLCVKDSEGNEYRFQLSTLLHGDTMVALETSRAQYKRSVEIESIAVEDAVVFQTPPSVHSDVITFMVNDNNIKVINKSENDLSNIFVYYKTYENDIAVGGITYRLSIPQLAAGETADVGTGHFNDDTCKFVFVTYEG